MPTRGSGLCLNQGELSPCEIKLEKLEGFTSETHVVSFMGTQGRSGQASLPASAPVQPQLSPGLPNAGLRVRGALQMQWAEVWALWAGSGGRYTARCAGVRSQVPDPPGHTPPGLRPPVELGPPTLGGTFCQDHDVIPSARAKGARAGQAKAGGGGGGGGSPRGPGKKGDWADP